jgi:hypothetical protein
MKDCVAWTAYKNAYTENCESLKLYLQIVDNKAVINVRKWWNWQTHHLEGVAPKGVGVQIPPSAPSTSFSIGE